MTNFKRGDIVGVKRFYPDRLLIAKIKKFVFQPLLNSTVAILDTGRKRLPVVVAVDLDWGIKLIRRGND